MLSAAVLVLLARVCTRRGDGPSRPPDEHRDERASHTVARVPRAHRSATGPVDEPAQSPVLSGDASTAAVPRSASSLGAPEREWLRARWGGGDRELGHELPSEANPEAPMSLAATRDGRAWILDQVNARIVRVDRDGRVDARALVTLRAAQDIATGPDGSFAVIDRLGDRAVELYDREGRSRGRVALGARVGESGGATGLFVEEDGVYVEREHGPLVRVADAEGHPIEPETAAPVDPDASPGPEIDAPGRPTRDGRSYVAASIADPAEGRVVLNVWERPSRTHRYARLYPLGSALRRLVLLDSDRAGTVYLAALGAFGAVDPSTGARASAVRMLCVESAGGRVIGQNTMPASEGPEETFREFSVLDDGGVLYLRRTREGASLEAWNCR